MVAGVVSGFIISLNFLYNSVGKIGIEQTSKKWINNCVITSTGYYF